jgi:DNA-binding beta-propeller fold protein YncE
MNLRCRLSLFTLLAALLLAGCAATEKPIVIFPLPPEIPRIEWLGTYASQNDFPKSGLEVFFEAITGTPPADGFKSPFGVAVDRRGVIYVADPLDHNIRVYDLEQKTAVYYTKIPQFSKPAGLAFDAEGNLYVVDNGKQIVLVFNAAHQPLRTIGGPQDFRGPTFIKIDDARDRVYVSDSLESKIVVFNRAGVKLSEIGPKLSATENLFNPQGMAIDKEGKLFIAEMLNARVVVVSPEGQLLRTFGTRGDAAYNFEAPKDLAFDSDGNLWVVDNRRPQIYTYTPEGALLLATGGDSRSEDSPLAFASPTAITIDANDNIYVTDRLNKRFAIWHYRSVAYNAAHPLTAAEQAALAAARAAGDQILKGSAAAPDKP